MMPQTTLYAQGGDLKQALINDETGLFEWGRKGKTVALDIARGLHFLHSCDVIHRCSLSNIPDAKTGSLPPSRRMVGLLRTRLLSEARLVLPSVEPGCVVLKFQPQQSSKRSHSLPS